jgi:hypothetical protein
MGKLQPMAKEKDFQTQFNKWAKHNLNYSCAVELKLTKTPSLPFSALAPHQAINLFLAHDGTLVHKIADVGIAPKPFDTFILHHVPAFVAVMFYRRGQKEFFMIPIQAWKEEEQLSQRQSLTEDRARALGQACYLA